MNHDLRSRINFCCWALLVAVAYVSLTSPVQAKGFAPSATKTPTGYDVRQAPGSTSGSSLGPVAGGVGVTASVALPVTGSAIAQAGITGAIGGLATAGAWGAAAGALGGIAIAAIPAIVDMMLRAKARVKPDGTYEIEDSTVCTVAPCYSYTFAASAGYASTPFGALQKWATYSTNQTAGYTYPMTYVADSVSGNTGYYHIIYTDGRPNLNATHPGLTSVSVAPSPASYVAASQAEVQTAISANAPTVAEVQALIDLNFPPEITPVSITGPAELPLGNTVQLGIDGTKTTVEEKATFSYFPGKVDISTKTKTTVDTPAQTQTGVTTNPDGTTSTFSITKPASTTVLEDTQTEVPKDDLDECTQYPNRAGCAELDDQTQETPLPKITENVTFTPVAFASNATCPAPLAITGTLPVSGSFNYSLSYQPLCDGVAIIRLFVLLACALIGIGVFVEGLR